jgi:hypothetical protein
MLMFKQIVSVFVLLFTSFLAWGQIKVSTITDESTSSSKAVMTALRSKISTHPKQFTLVGDKDLDQGLIVMADCIPQKQTTDAFACHYTLLYAGAISKAFMGGGISSAATSDEVANNLLASILQDVRERWAQTARSNTVESLEACLFLTRSSCNVPESLVPELKTKVINLSQYFQKGDLKK